MADDTSPSAGGMGAAAPAGAGAGTGAAAAAAPAVTPAPIIVRKIIVDGHSAHGGAWKIALADMMTAMMAFFLLMWILGSTNEAQRKSIADYFKPTTNTHVTTGKLSGSGKPLAGDSVIGKGGLPHAPQQTGRKERVLPDAQAGEDNADTSASGDAGEGASQGEGGGNGAGGGGGSGNGADNSAAAAEQRRAADQANFEKLEKDLREKLSQNRRLAGLQDQVSITREKDGLRIDIIDKADFSMFASGTTDMLPRADQLIAEVASTLQGLPNHLAMRGHTDAVQFSDGTARNNWQLSAERAETIRQAVAKHGIGPDRFARLEGVADTQPMIKGNPSDPRNRRISITVLNQ